MKKVNMQNQRTSQDYGCGNKRIITRLSCQSKQKLEVIVNKVRVDRIFYFIFNLFSRVWYFQESRDPTEENGFLT